MVGKRMFVLSLFTAGIIALNGMSAFAADKSYGMPVNYGASAAILIEAESGRVIFSQNIDERLPMASTTKIMTSLIALEQGNLDEEFVVDSEAIQVEGSSMGLKEGDVVSQRDLVYGMILPSGNDAANCTAVRISGSNEKFAELMNERAEELGLSDTHFVTPSGLDAPDHYSTAYDMARLTRYAMKNPEFREICSQYRAQISFGNPPYDRWLKNHNRLLEMYDGCIGVKTGFTDNAKRCLVSAAKRDDTTLICVTLNAPDDWKIHSDMYDRAFSSMKRRSLESYVPKELLLPVSGAKERDSVRVICQNTPRAFLTEEEFEKIETKVTLKPLDFAPIKHGEAVGEIAFTLDGEAILSTDLVAYEDVLAREIKFHPFERILRFFKR